MYKQTGKLNWIKFSDPECTTVQVRTLKKRRKMQRKRR
jgi:hypothetical protein